LIIENVAGCLILMVSGSQPYPSSWSGSQIRTEETMRRLGLLCAGAFAVAVSLAAPAFAKERFVFVGHWPVSDPYFNVVRNAAELAAQQLDVTVEFRNPPNGDLAQMADLINQAAASKPDGIIATVPDESIVSGPLTNAVDTGIPLVIVNSGSAEIAKKLGALLYIGQAEYAAGLAAGKKAKAAGVTSFVCVNHFFAQPVSHDRCNGFAAGLGIPIGDQDIDSGIDPDIIVSRTAAYLKTHPKTQAILALGPTAADPIIKYLNDQGMTEKYYFATFDLDQDILGALKSGEIKVAVDQQPFLQGYDAVQTLVLYDRYGVLQANNVESGPGLITKDNLQQVLDLAGKYR
jgi:simple sugar transport system substrate-binding protein